jgi:hypothetical protein
VFIAAGKNAEDTIEASQFKPIWDVLNALKAHDDVLACELDQLRTELGRKPGSGVSAGGLGKIAIDLPVTVDANFGSALRTYLVEQVTASWDERFGELLTYKAKHGSTLVPRDWPTGLATWVSNQRSSANGGKRGALSIERRNRLDSIGFIWDVSDAQWEARFAELLAYKVDHGDVNIPNEWHTGLGAWIGTQRQYKKRMCLAQEKIVRLNEIGFDWDPVETQWRQRFEELIAYKTEHDSLDVPVSWPTGLGSWVNVQRTFCKNRKLSPEKIRQLNDVGFNWDHHATRWNEMFRQLLAYKTEHGDVRVPDEWPTGLGKWVGKQRAFRKNGSLSVDRLRRLSEIGLDWDTLDSKWDEKFDELLAYKAEYGDLNVQVDWPTGLGRWASVQRKYKRKGILSQERARRLFEVGFRWEPFDEQWEVMFGELLAYKLKYGHVNIPFDAESKLWRWVGTQRQSKKRGKLSAEKVGRLDDIGFAWDLLESQWESKFSELLTYQATHGNINVPRGDSTGLAAWIGKQRAVKKARKISAERIQRLEEIGFEWERNNKLK